MVKLKLVSLITNSNSLMFTCNVNFNKSTSNKTEVQGQCKVMFIGNVCDLEI